MSCWVTGSRRRDEHAVLCVSYGDEWMGRAVVNSHIHRGLKTLASLIGFESERALDKDG